MSSPKAKGRKSPKPEGKPVKPASPKTEKTPRPERTVADWEIIEGQYRAGILSIRTIAAQHGISDTAIRLKAKAEGWQRDLAEKVRKEAREELLRTPTSHKSPKEAEREAVQTIVAVVREHQLLLKRGHGVIAGLLAELQETADNREAIEAIIEAEGDDAKHKAMLRRAIGLPSRTGVMLNLSAAIKNIIVLERQAFGVDDADKGNDADDDNTVIVLPANGR
jgi:hypothetical protein